MFIYKLEGADYILYTVAAVQGSVYGDLVGTLDASAVSDLDAAALLELVYDTYVLVGSGKQHILVIA